jgi:hypothetical protein
MLTHNATIVRANTYEDYFRVCLISNDQEWSENRAKWLTDNEDQPNSPFSTYKSKFKGNANIVVYARSHKKNDYNYATVGLDALAIMIENEVEWNAIKKLVTEDYKNVPVKVIVSDNRDAVNWQREIDAQEVLPGTVNPQKLKNKMDAWDTAEYYKIKDAFDKYDIDKSGFLEKREFKKIAEDLGETKENMKKAVASLDANKDNKMELNEFINWWKVGRFNVDALVKIFEFGTYSNNFVNKFIDRQKFHEDASYKSFTQNSLPDEQPNNINFKMTTEPMEEILTRIQMKIALGADKAKDEAVKNFLSKFSNVHDSKEENWLDICVFVKSLTMNGKELKDYLENFRSKLIDYAEKNMVAGLSTFLRDFVIFKFTPHDNSASIVFKMKDDVYSILKTSLHEFLDLKDYLTNNGKSHLLLSTKILSAHCLGDLVKENGKINNFLEKSEVNIEGSLLKTRVKSFLMNLHPQYKKYLNLLQFLFAPSGLKFNFKGPISDLLLNDSLKNLLQHDVEFLKPFVEFLKANFERELLDNMSRFEVGFNLYDIFFNLQIFSHCLWE